MKKKKAGKRSRNLNNRSFEKSGSVTHIRKYLTSAGLFLFILLLPTQLGKHFFLPFSYLSGVRTDYLAPTLYLTDIVVLFLILLNLPDILSLLRKKIMIVVLCLLAINTAFSLSIPVSLYASAKILELIIVGVLFKKYLPPPKILLYGFLISGFFELFLSVFQFVEKQSIQGIFYFFGERMFDLTTPGIAKASINGVQFLRPYATFSHPNSLAGFFLLLYGVVLIYPIFNPYKILRFIFLFVSAALVFLSFSKLAIVCFFLVNLFYFIETRKRTLCRLCVATKILVFAALALIVLSAKGDPLTVQKRLELAAVSLNILLQHLAVGVGAGAYLVAQNKYIIRLPFIFNQPVHNFYLLFFAEFGFITGIPFLVLAAGFLRPLIKKTWIIVCIVLFTGLFDHYWLTLQQNFLLMGCMAGLIATEAASE